VDDVDQFLSRDDARVIAWRSRVEHVLADVILDHFGDEAIEGTPTGGCLLQHAGALEIGLDRPLDGIDLTAQAFEAIQ
jgi:hypothetical protein